MEQKLTLIEHLNELRKRLIISVVSLFLGTMVSFSFARQILKILKLPASGIIEKLNFFAPQEAFLVYFRLAFLSALIITMPIILYQIWAFISPAIEERFRRYVAYFILFSSLSFILGCLFAYYVLIPHALKFLLSFADDNLEAFISAGRYISFVTALIIGSGLIFQFPVVSFILTKVKIINHTFLRRKYRYAIAIIFIIAAVITPTPDAINMLLLAVPMLFLYEFSIWVSMFAGRA